MQHSIAFLLLAAPALSLAAGTFSGNAITGDADSGIAAGHAYTVAVDVFDGGNRTINNSVFTGSGGGANPATNNYATGGLNNGFTGFSSGLTGNVGGLMNNFLYNGNPATYTLNNLRVGETYTTTFYNAAFGGPGGRVHNITTSDGGVLNNYDQNATTGSVLNYTFTATATSQTFTMTPQNPGDTWHHYGFSNRVMNQKALLTDNFYAPSNPDTMDLNFNLAARQGGVITTGGTVSWVASGNTQVGNTTGGMDAGNYLLNAFFNGTAALDYNFNGSASQGGLSIAFDMAPNSTNNGDYTNWQAINIGQNAASKNDVINAANPHLGILFRGNGGMEVWDGNNVVTGAPTYSATSHTNDFTRIELLFTDPGDQNPFDGIGQTDIAVYANGELKYNWSKTGGGYANNYINFSNSFIGGVDNLVIAQIIPEPGTTALAALAGLSLLRRRRR